MNLKKLFLFSLPLLGISAFADENDYIVIKESTGEEAYFKTNDLSFKISGENFIAISGEEETSFSFPNLLSMEFSSEPTAVASIYGVDAEVEVFTTSGQRIGIFSSAANAEKAISESGIYIFKSQNKTIKMIIKK